MEAQNGAVAQNRAVEAQNIAMPVCRPEVAASHHFEEEQDSDPDPDPH